MSKSYHLPDWVSDGLADGSVDHLDYTTANVARVVMADGSAQSVSTVVTDAIIDEDRAAARRSSVLLYAFSITTELRRKVRSGITGWTQ